MKKMWLWAVVAILFVSSLAVFAGCEKREYVEVYEVREGNWAYSDKVTFFWGDNVDGLTLEQYAFDCKKVKVLKKVAAQTFPYESGEMLLNFDEDVNPATFDPKYQPDELDSVSADAAACGMIYSFYGRLSVGTTDVDLLHSGNLPPTFYCYGTRDPFYKQFLANADASEEAGVAVERLQLDGMPHGFGASGDWIPTYDQWLSAIFADN